MEESGHRIGQGDRVERHPWCDDKDCSNEEAPVEAADSLRIRLLTVGCHHGVSHVEVCG